MTFHLSTYLISNRQADDTIGAVQYLRCANAPDQRYNDHLVGFRAESKDAWLQQLASDLLALCEGQPQYAVLDLYVHGYNNSSQDAVTGLMHYGNGLYAQGLQHGIVVGLSWPSKCMTPMGGRQNAEGSYALLEEALACFAEVQARLSTAGVHAPRLIRTLTTHSMGNYLMTKGLTRDGFEVPRNGLDRAIMLAADVDNDIFTAGSKVLSQGEAVYKLTGGNVRVYWTAKDNVLRKDEYAGWWKILGLRGAYDGDTRRLSPTTPEVQLVCYDDFADEDFSRRYVPNDYDASACSHSITRFAPDLLRDQLGFLLRPSKD